MAQLNRLATALVVSVLAACGGKSFDVGEADPNDGGTNQGGTSNVGADGGTSSKGGTTAKGGTAWGGTGQGGSSGFACDAYDDQAPSQVQVAIINKSSAPIHLGDDVFGCAATPHFDVKNEAGMLLAPLGACRSPCQLVREQGELGCPAICALPATITLQPGEAYHTSYHGLYSVPRELPAECAIAEFGANRCEQAVAIQPGTFTFEAGAGTAIDCSQASGDSMCGACSPHGNGGCSTPGSLISGKMLQATTTVLLDSSYGVYGQPQRAPAPRPDPGSAGASGSGSGAVALAVVELVFTD